MKLTVILVVAAFLLYSVVAERNGPTNILTPPRRSNLQQSGERIIELRRENPNNSRRRPGTVKVMGVPRTPRNTQRKFLGMMAPRNPFTVRSRRSDVMPPRNSPSTELHHKRRSFELGTASNRLSHPEIDEAVIFLEPVYREESKTDFLSYLLGKHFAHDSNDELGPSIGPLKIPGIGNNVYMRLMVPPGKDTTSHVTVHLVNKAPVESIGDVYETAVDSAPSSKPNPLFPGKKPIPIMAPIRSKPLISSRPMNSRRSRFVLDKSFHHFGFTPSKLEPMGPFRIQNHLKMSNHRPTRFGNPRQYSAAPNHHQLPIVLRPADNMIDLPIYPPLSADGLKYGMDFNLSKSNVSTDSTDDTQQSASAKHTAFSRDNLNSQTAWQSISVLVLPESGVTSNRGESPEPIFIEEIIAPDLNPGNVSTARENSLWRKLNVGSGYRGSVNLQLENTGSTRDATEDKHVVPDTLDYPSRHTTTTYKTDYLFPQDDRSGEPEEDNPGADQRRSSTSNPSPTEGTGSGILKRK